MGAGSVLLYSGSVIHGGGENRSDADRTGVNITYTLGWLRTEENQFLSCPPEVAKELDPELADLMGYSMATTPSATTRTPMACRGQSTCSRRRSCWAASRVPSTPTLRS